MAIPLLLCCLVGCRANSAPPKSPAPPPAGVSTLSADQQVLLKLDCYDPMYKIDADGRVTILRLLGRNLRPDALAEIGKLTELEILDLYGANLTDDGLANLNELQKLRMLGLGGTPITDKALTHLGKLQALNHVWLPKRAISKTGLEKLKEACPDVNVHPQ
ncbi:MAG TPA: hypothetical protein VFE62_13370 [Gemmataceae bacterium]|nr:hypothetical protein [Gemmataceae bacterium]